MNPFEYLNAINNTKKNIMVDDVAERQYNSFMVNRGLSYFVDTVLMANEMNINHQLDSRLQYDFLLNTIRKRKRFSKWDKKSDNSAISAIQKYYKYNIKEAEAAIKVLTKEQIDEIIRRTNFRGIE